MILSLGGKIMAKSDALFVTEAQCADRLGLSLDQYKTAIIAASKAGFPQPDPLFGNRRYWPAVRVWLDRRYGLHGAEIHGPYPPDAEEPWKRKGVSIPLVADQRSKGRS